MAKARLPHTRSEISERFTRIIVFANPASTNALRSLSLVSDLQKFAPDATLLTVAIPSDPQKAGLQSIKHLLGPKTLLCIAAGDGTINTLASQLLLDHTIPPEAHLTCVLPLWGGNANDLACMLNGSPPASLVGILSNAKIESMSVIQMRLDNETKLALSSLSFGATAHIAHALNNDAFRKSVPKSRFGRYRREIQTAAMATSKSPRILLLENDNLVSICEYMVVNGPRMAKHFSMPVNLVDPDFYVQIFRKRRHMVSPTIKALIAKRIAKGGARKTHLSFKTHSAMLCQIDGETMMIPADTNIDIAILPQRLQVLTSADTHLRY